MLKKFVPLTADGSPTKNPYEVRTFLGDNCKPKPEWCVESCPPIIHKCPPNNTIAKILTIEDEIRRIHEKAQVSRFQKPFQPFCSIGDDFLACIVPQRKPEELKTHALMREYYLQTKRDLKSRVHEPKHKFKHPKIHLDSPAGVTEEEEEVDIEEGFEEEEPRSVKPELATPTCSLDAIYEPTDRVLELTRPTSGWFHNETEPPQVPDDGMDYSTYNPRNLQEKLDQQDLKRYDLIQGKTPLDLWTWNIGYQQKDIDLDRQNKDAMVLKFDCDSLELKLYNVPRDLSKTFRVEIVFGSDAVRLEPPSINRQYYCRPLEMACLYVAYVDSFTLNPDFWTAETMDKICATAEKLIKRSVSGNYRSPDTPFDILPQIIEKNAVVGIREHFSGPIKSDPNLYKGLSLHFSKFNAAILCTKNLYLLIWKRCSNSYYIFDPNGRNESCIRDFENGKCSLISIHFIEHLVHLILRYSKAQYMCDFHIYEIFLVNFGKLSEPPFQPLPKEFKRLWRVINGTFALIPAGNTGLQQPVTGKEQNASMIISLLALLYSEIEYAQSWEPEVLDDIYNFGMTYFKHLAKRLKLKPKEQLNIIDLPEHLMMGSYKATLSKRPFLSTGNVAECKDFHDSQLTVALNGLFASPWDMGLLQVDNLVLAVWRDERLYYLFDPFRRGRVGQVMDPEDYRTKGVACLQLHSNFDSFCRYLYDKAIQMRRGGKFFLHGVKINCIKPLMAAAELPNRYPKLKLEYPEYKFETEQPPADGVDVQEEEPEPVVKPTKPKKTKAHLPRSNSIVALPEIERLPEFTGADVVKSLMTELLCEIISGFPEDDVPRSRLYKQAEKVLLRSDRSYLNLLKHNVLHKADEDNIFASKQTQPDEPPQPMTLEEELRIPCNYELLPDGTWVIFGESEMPIMQEETMKLGGLLAGIITAALSAKYKVSTWNSQLIEYALEAVNSFDGFEQYERTLSELLYEEMPRISIGTTTYQLEIKKIWHASRTSSLRQILLESLICYNRLMVICPRFSCVIFKRYNFLYMFIGFACNAVGYRKMGPGPACMLRFIELDALLRRIEFGCDPRGCEVTNYVVVALKVRDVTTEPPDQIRHMLPKDERELYLTERDRLKSERMRRKDKLRFLNDQLYKENERIEKFLAEKKKRAEEREVAREERHKQKGKKTKKAKGKGKSKSDGEAESEFDAEEHEYTIEGEVEEEESVKLKHKRGKKLKHEVKDESMPRPVEYGYRMRHKDYLYKIQGTVALPDREKASNEQIKACFFTSAVAVIYAAVRPLNQWTSARVDRVITTGVAIVERVTNMTVAFERIIKNITVDDYRFDIWVKGFEVLGTGGLSLKGKLQRALAASKYLLLQTSNGTYAIYQDEFLHLFDPYGSMEKSKTRQDDEGAEEEDLKKRRAHKIKKYCERNTASWVLFPDIEDMLKYIDERAENPNWKKRNEHQLHTVMIIHHEKAPIQDRILQMLTNMEMSPECEKYNEEIYHCARGESMAWLDMESCLPVWSRLNRRNTAGNYRGIPSTKLRKFDIEIEKRLWSLWGCLSPYAPVFSPTSRGKQFLACNVIASLAAHLYRLTFWSPQLLDSIVISGDKYHGESLKNITRDDYEFSIEDLGTQCQLRDIRFVVHLEYVAMGRLYCLPSRQRMNLADALMYFFTRYNYGILQCQKRSLAFGFKSGRDGGYYMFDCQSRDAPLFPKGQGAAYMLRTTHLQVLVYCIVVTLNVTYYNVPFTLHKVDMLREGALVEQSGEEESRSREK